MTSATARADGASGIFALDTFVGDGAIHGADVTLAVGSTKSALLRFSLAALPKNVTAADIEYAQLVIFPSAVTTAGSVDIFAIDPAATWNENTTSMPALTSASALDRPIALSSTNKADITSPHVPYTAHGSIAPGGGAWKVGICARSGQAGTVSLSIGDVLGVFQVTN